MRDSLRARAAQLVVVAVCLSFGVYATIAVWRQSFLAIDGHRYFNIVDDGLITLRYAWNLAHGNGLVWNPGERVEGITNPGWAIYAAALAVFVDRRVLPFAVALTGIATLIVAALACRRIYLTLARSESASDEPVLGTLALLAPLCYVPLVNWTLWGMETGPVAALVTVALSLMVGASSSLAGSCLLGVAFCIRPDVAVPAVVVLGLRWWRRRRSIELLPFLGVALAFTLARHVYYGSLLPNTYILKVSGTPVLERIRGNGLLYVSSWINDSRALVALLLTSLIVRPKREKFLLASALASMLAYCLYVGGDAFTQWRFVAPYVPLAYLVILSDVPALNRRLAAWIADVHIAPRVAPAVSAATAGLFLLHVWTQTFTLRQYPSPENIANTNTAIFLDRVLGPEATVGVFFAGSIPYYTGRRAVDFLGKGDAHIASLLPDRSGAISARGMRNIPGHDKYDLVYSILEKQPTFIAGTTWGRQDITPAANEYYVRVPVNFDTWPDVNDRTVRLLRDSPDVDWAQVRSSAAAR